MPYPRPDDEIKQEILERDGQECLEALTKARREASELENERFFDYKQTCRRRYECGNVAVSDRATWVPNYRLLTAGRGLVR